MAANLCLLLIDAPPSLSVLLVW